VVIFIANYLVPRWNKMLFILHHTCKIVVWACTFFFSITPLLLRTYKQSQCHIMWNLLCITH